MTKSHDLTTLSDDFSAVHPPPQGTAPIGTPIPNHDILTQADMATISQLAAELLDDPMALQQLCDHIHTLLIQDLSRQRTP